MFWNNVVSFFSFTGITDVTVWQDVAVSTVMIPIGLIIINKLLAWWDNVRPASLVLKGCLSKDVSVLIFHSQMSGADDNYNFNPTQKYVTRYPDPLPTDKAHLEIQRKLRIDPILSQAEADCLADVYNVLGRAGKVKNIVSADLISDWSKWSTPIFSVGFNPKTTNPKTLKVLGSCEPVYFELHKGGMGGMELKDASHKVNYDSIRPYDAGVIQKTFTKNGNVPVFLLAGLGTAGTGAAGFIFNKYLIDLGKLYGSSPFCVFLKVSTTEGRESAYIDKICPSPSLKRGMLYPFTFLKYKNKAL